MSILKKLGDSEAFTLRLPQSSDNRGTFTKVFQSSWFNEVENFIPRESYWTSSKPNVLRGFHLQMNEASQAKLVTCINGDVLDLIVDLRKGDKFGKVYTTRLNSSENNSIFIPKGYGHAFINDTKTNCLINYIVETEYSPENDTGVKWNSVKYEWPINDPLVSERDNNLKDLSDFQPL